MVDSLMLAGAELGAKSLYKKIRPVLQTERANAEFREQLDDLFLEISRQVQTDGEVADDDDRPTVEDAWNMCVSFCEEYEQASGNKKRKILFNAFFASFRPEFYTAGMNRILWDYVVKLEYPDAVLLRQLMDLVADQKRRDPGGAMFTLDDRTNFRGNETPISTDRSEMESARRLAKLGLVAIREDDRGDALYVRPYMGICEKLRQFIWDDGEAEPAGSQPLAPGRQVQEPVPQGPGIVHVEERSV